MIYLTFFKTQLFSLYLCVALPFERHHFFNGTNPLSIPSFLPTLDIPFDFIYLNLDTAVSWIFAADLSLDYASSFCMCSIKWTRFSVANFQAFYLGCNKNSRFTVWTSAQISPEGCFKEPWPTVRLIFYSSEGTESSCQFMLIDLIGFQAVQLSKYFSILVLFEPHLGVLRIYLWLCA